MTWKRQVLRLVFLMMGFLGGSLVVLALLENFLLYHPVRAAQEWYQPPGMKVEDVTLQTADGVAIHAWWCPCEGATGALLYCHGNAGNLSYRGPAIAEFQREMKESVLIFDYPGYGRSDGEPSEAGCYAAADAAYDWLTQAQHIPADRLLLYGKSLGGGVAVELATRRAHRALILAKTFTSIPDLGQKLFPVLPVRWMVRNRFDNLSKIDQCPQPIFIAHGTTDGLIPFTHGKRLYEAAPEPKFFLPMAGVDHNDPFSTDFYPALRNFLQQAEGTQQAAN